MNHRPRKRKARIKMKPIRISLQKAKRIALNAQLLSDKLQFPEGKEGVAQVIERLGYIQIDTISVVERSHHHTLWARFPDYTPQMLHELQAKDRRIFEYWGHAASYLPIADYRYYLPRMRSFDDPKSKWAKDQLQEHGHLMQAVLDRIREEGPLSSKDFTGDSKRGPWWDWKPMKVALELLFWQGQLMISERRKFQKVYDLTERVLPQGTNTQYPSAGELGRFLLRRALLSYGIARKKEICEHIHGMGKKSILCALGDLSSSGEIVSLQIKGHDDPYYALAKTLEDGDRAKKPPQVFIISPFDNFIIQRERIARLFGFEYVLECYVPAPKRRYGYFTMPVLWGEKFPCRIDCKADRRRKNFVVRNLVFEPEFRDVADFLPVFACKLRDLALFNHCLNIEIEKTIPARIKQKLQKMVNSALPGEVENTEE